jgi:energy-coupling factor transporter ATP-binding protein EcfA2
MTPGPGASPTPALRVGGTTAAARPVPGAVAGPLLDAVADLRRDVERTHLPLPVAGADEALALRIRLLDQLDDHLLPRLRELSAPAVVVVAGSTGAGKSTLMNSLLGQEVSAAGVLRPTTREPVLAHHSADAELLASHPLLEIVSVVVHDAVPRGLTLVDAPDLDSLLTSNRATAHRLLEAADLWIFLTTAARYGDALPWDVLAEAAERGVSMAMVLNRVPAAALAPIRTDLMARLRDRGMAAVPLFLIPDLGPHEGLLDPATVAPIRRWLAMVAGPDRARSVILRTQRGALRRLQPWVGELVDAVQAQVDARVGLERVVRAAVQAPADAAAAGVLGGGVVAGPVRARWASSAGLLTGRAASRRARAARADALGRLASDLRATVVVMLTGARRAGDSALAEALGTTDVPGAEAVPGAGVAPADADPSAGAGPAVDALPPPEESAADWLLSGAQMVRTLAASRDRKVARPARRLHSAFGEDGSGTLLCLAAAGLGAASAQVTGALGSAVTQDALTTLRNDLANRAAAQAMDAARPALTFLGSTDLADDATAALRVRLAVLKGLR